LKEISFTDGTVKIIHPNGDEHSIFPDGTVQKILSGGTKSVEHPSGQKDTLYADGMKERR